MKSPRFILRETEIKDVFASSRLRHTWKRKVRSKLRSHPLPDPIEHLDFHLNLTENCRQLEQLVCSGHYLPAPAHRILMEKSRGLCRQIVIPHVRDALVLQCLSDALYDDIRGKAPSKRAFFEPEDHTFSAFQESILAEPRYGSLRAWLDFQRALFNFTKTHHYIVVTDIANYYDYISYAHLRNIVASKIHIRESILDMLIFVLSGLLWQPDYAPRVEIGLPQMSIDASRILAHCFLYELDEFLEKVPVEFVRYMDDIDIGVESVDDARRLLRDLDLVLHTRQVRLNTGKTLILNHTQAERHFRVKENYLIRAIVSRLDRKLKANTNLDRERKHVARALHKYYKRGNFDDGNGEKILSLLLKISRRINVEVDYRVMNDILRRRPRVRAAAFRVIEWQRFTPRLSKLVVAFLTSGVVVDEWSYIESSDALVHVEARTKPDVQRAIQVIARRFLQNGFFGTYAAIWLMSKYGTADQIYQILVQTKTVWQPDIWLGRLVGGLIPIFYGTTHEDDFRQLSRSARNPGAEEVIRFHELLTSDPQAVRGVSKIILAKNDSKRLGITHAKFLILLSILANTTLSERYKLRYVDAHKSAWQDAFYRWRARSVVQPPSLRAHVKP